MTISIHEILEVNGRKPVINNYVKFLIYEGKNYAYMNRFPYRISFMELNDKLLEILKQFDGIKTVNEIYESYSLDMDFIRFIKILYKNSFLQEKDIPEGSQAANELTIIFYPTNACNLRCIYCYASAGDAPAQMIDLKKAEAWIDYIFSRIDEKIKSIKVLFHGGGEPTMAVDLMKSICAMVKNKAKEINLPVRLHSISNGNFNENVLNWFIEEKANILFSMDGTKESHDRLRPRADGKGSFDYAYDNLKKLYDAGLQTAIRCTVTNSNLNNLKDLIDLIKECGTRTISFEKCSSFGRSGESDEVNISNKDFIDHFLEVWRYALDNGVNTKGFPTMAIQAGRKYFCNDYSDTSFSLTAEGLLSACPEVSQKTDKVADTFIVGKVDEANNIELYRDRIEKLKERIPENIPVCKDCFMQFVCNCGCSVKSYRKNNDLLQVDESECGFLREISATILKTLLHNHEIFPKELEFENFKYSLTGKGRISADYISFIPFDFVNH